MTPSTHEVWTRPCCRCGGPGPGVPPGDHPGEAAPPQDTCPPVPPGSGLSLRPRSLEERRAFCPVPAPRHPQNPTAPSTGLGAGRQGEHGPSLATLLRSRPGNGSSGQAAPQGAPQQLWSVGQSRSWRRSQCQGHLQAQQRGPPTPQPPSESPGGLALPPQACLIPGRRGEARALWGVALPCFPAHFSESWGHAGSWPCPQPPRQLGLSWPPHSPTHPSPGRSRTPRRPGTRRPRRHPGRPGRELSGVGASSGQQEGCQRLLDLREGSLHFCLGASCGGCPGSAAPAGRGSLVAKSRGLQTLCSEGHSQRLPCHLAGICQDQS